VPYYWKATVESQRLMIFRLSTFLFNPIDFASWIAQLGQANMPAHSSDTTDNKGRLLSLATLVVAGEAIFFLPFILPRIFRPTLLEVFEINNFELGLFFSFYGIVAMAAYFFGGPLADKYPTRNLMTIALVLTAVGGLFMATIPAAAPMKFLYAGWGITTILLFWSALIRATRQWGGDKLQGRAFAFLDGGRGLVGAIIGTLAVGLLAWWMPEQPAALSVQDKSDAFRHVILFFAVMTFGAAVMVWYVLPVDDQSQNRIDQISIKAIKPLLVKPAIWLQAIIIVCAYVGYKITDDFSLLAKDILGFDDVSAAGIGTLALWMRPIVSISLGFFADRFRLTKLIMIGFGFTIVGGLVIGSGISNPGVVSIYLATIIATTIGVYGVRGLYFSIMGEGKIPLIHTGTAVGLISVIGYTPDFFMGPLMGYLLDASPGALGHQHVFLLLAGFSVVGLGAAFWFRKVSGS